MSHVSSTRLAQAVAHLRRGGVVLYPTETAYGFGADARNPRAVRRVFRVKGRAASKAVPLIVSSVRMAETVAVLGPRARALARAHWPGPLTLVLPVRPGARLAAGVTYHGTVALRVSAHPVSRALARRLGGPIVATSANRSGKPATYRVAMVAAQFGKIPADVFVLDTGPLPRRKSSTIVDMIHGQNVLRQGAIRL